MGTNKEIMKMIIIVIIIKVVTVVVVIEVSTTMMIFIRAGTFGPAVYEITKGTTQTLQNVDRGKRLKEMCSESQELNSLQFT